MSLITLAYLFNTTTPNVAGISDRSPQSLATNARVRGLTSKHLKPRRSYVPATHERDGVAPRSRSCAPGLRVWVETVHIYLDFYLFIYFFFFFHGSMKKSSQLAKKTT